MKRYKCYIVDDEPLAIKVIEQHLGKFPQFEICGTSTEPILALAQVKSRQPDLLFLDIQMPDLTGLDFISIMQNKPEVVITTAFREYAVEGFALNVLDYLVKPIPFTRFAKTIDRFLDTKHGTPTATSERGSTILIKADRKTVRLGLSEILYIEGVKDYIKIVLSDQTILTKVSIGNFMKQLPGNDFLRVHKSFIVARDKITAFTAKDVEIDRKEIPIGRMYKENALKTLQQADK